MRVESGDILYPHFSGDNQTDCIRPFFLPRKKRPGPEAIAIATLDLEVLQARLL